MFTEKPFYFPHQLEGDPHVGVWVKAVNGTWQQASAHFTSRKAADHAGRLAIRHGSANVQVRWADA